MSLSLKFQKALGTVVILSVLPLSAAFSEPEPPHNLHSRYSSRIRDAREEAESRQRAAQERQDAIDAAKKWANDTREGAEKIAGDIKDTLTLPPSPAPRKAEPRWWEKEKPKPSAKRRAYQRYEPGYYDDDDNGHGYYEPEPQEYCGPCR